MKIAQFRIFNEFDVNINIYELIYWNMFFCFIEFILPILIDPIGLSVEIFGFDFEEIFELLIFILIPFFILYFGDIMSGFNYFIALLFYGLLSAPVSSFLIHNIFSDILGILFILIYLDELYESQNDNEGDFMDDSEDFSEDYFNKK